MWKEEECEPSWKLEGLYQFCGYALYLVAAGCICTLWATNVVGPETSGPLALVIALLWYWNWRRDTTRRTRQAWELTTRLEGPLAATIRNWEVELRKYASTPEAQLVLVPGETIRLSTLPTTEEPVVAMTAGFLSTYGQDREIVQTAIAREAGHVAVGDSGRFDRLRCWIRLAAICATAVLVWTALIRPPIVTLAMSLIFVIAVLILALSYRALENARELTADAFAARILNQRGQVERFLSTTLNPRYGSKQHRWPMSWFAQRYFVWRTALPALKGEVGWRVDFRFGFALGCAIAVWIFLAPALLAGSMGKDGNKAAIAVLIECGVVNTWWVIYGFCWASSRYLGGRNFAALWRNLACIARFALPTWLLFVTVVHPIVAAVGRAYSSDVHLLESQMEPFLRDPLALYEGTFFLVAWSAGKCALLSAKERRRTRPGLIRAIAFDFLIMILLSFVAMTIPTMWRFRPAAIALAPIAIGAFAHISTREINVNDASGLATMRSKWRDFGASARVKSQSSWLTISVASNAILLLANYAGVSSPPWLLNLLNPVAWISNIAGLTHALAGPLTIVDQVIARMSTAVGLPIIGSLIIWFMVSRAPQRWITVHFIAIVLPGFLVFQLTVERAFIKIGDEFAKRGDSLHEARARAQAAYLLKQMGLSEAMGMKHSWAPAFSQGKMAVELADYSGAFGSDRRAAFVRTVDQLTCHPLGCVEGCASHCCSKRAFLCCRALDLLVVVCFRAIELVGKRASSRATGGSPYRPEVTSGCVALINDSRRRFRASLVLWRKYRA